MFGNVQPKQKIKMSKSIQLKNNNNEKMYPHPYYPTGSIYLSVNNINPSQWFGGTWEQIAKGRTLVGVDTSDTDFNTVKKTGGAKTHILSINEMPGHSHNNPCAVTYNGSAAMNRSLFATNSDFWTKSDPNNATASTGGGQAHNNLQPYFTCYIWCRVA